MGTPAALNGGHGARSGKDGERRLAGDGEESDSEQTCCALVCSCCFIIVLDRSVGRFEG